MYPNLNQGYPANNSPYPTQQNGFPQPDQYGFSPLGGQQPGGQPGYPPQQNAGYPPQQGGYPPQQGGYPPQSGGYPPQQGGYPPQQGGYPPQQGGYPPQQGGYPPQSGGYPPQQGGYPPQDQFGQQSAQQPAYPSQSGGYPPQQGGYPPQQGGYPAQSGGYPQQEGAYPSAHPAGYTLGAPAQATSHHYEPTLLPCEPFDAMSDSQRLYKAMKGFGTDETTLLDVLCKRTSDQRQQIKLQYKSDVGKDLVKNLKGETGGNLEKLLMSLMMTPSELEAHDLRKALDGMGTNEFALIDVVCTKNNQEMRDLKDAYRRMYGKDLENEVSGDVSGYMRRLLVSLITANRSNAAPDQMKAAQQAKDLQKAGAKRLGTDEVQFNRIFASESYEQLKMVFDEYYKLTGKDIDKALKDEMSGSVERAFLTIAQIARNPPAYYAQRIYESTVGMGTNDRDLIRLIVTRSEIDMVQVKQMFERKYGKSLEGFIKGDCSGDYKRGLLCLIGSPNWK